MKRKILVGNWKMNKTIAETIDFVNKVFETYKWKEKRPSLAR